MVQDLMLVCRLLSLLNFGGLRTFYQICRIQDSVSVKTRLKSRFKPRFKTRFKTRYFFTYFWSKSLVNFGVF